MKSRQLLTVVVALAVIVAGYWWIARRSAQPEARETPTVERGAGSSVQPDLPRVLLPIPEPSPVAEAAPDPESERAAAPPAPVQDFAIKYMLKSVEELRDAQALISKQEFAAAQARLDELWLKFPELLAKGEYGARVVAPGTEISHPEGDWATRTGGTKNPDGTDAVQIIQFDTGAEPATASLHAESKWLRARISSLKKKS